MSEPQAVLLRGDNFTPASRTPWGGRKIVHNIKSLANYQGSVVVGESWELSAGPDFASIAVDGRPLADIFAAEPAAWLGDDADRGCALLVKLLDAQDHLSLQIHPRDDYGGLLPHEGGKPESWYVIDHGPDAAVYLGFAPGVDRQAVERCVRGGDDLSALMQRVPVRVGDFIVLDAGTPHAVGAGVTLVEPQRVLQGRVGVTYRYWDWNRRYDAQGRLDAAGSPRELHLDHALAVTDFAHATDPVALSQRRLSAGKPMRGEPARLCPLCGPGADSGLISDDLRVARLEGTGPLALPDWRQLRALTVIEGSVRVGELRVGAGHTAALPADMGPRPLELDAAHAILSAAT